MRKCRNWQTSKTKDLVAFVPCGFKSHLPQDEMIVRNARGLKSPVFMRALGLFSFEGYARNLAPFAFFAP